MQDFSQHLTEARNKAGFSQADCAHLLGVSQSHISRLELGRSIPSVTDLCGVAILFGRAVETLAEPVFQERALAIQKNLVDLPDMRTGWMGRFMRNNALKNLEDRIGRIIEYYG